MLFSVIVPNYNHAEFLKQRIESILHQTFQDFELIILDDASTDNSLAIIEQYKMHPKVSHIIQNNTNSGSPFKQWIKGIEAAAGNWIWIAESDDFADERFLQHAANAIISNPTIGLYYCDTTFVHGQDIEAKTFSKNKNVFFNTNKWDDSYLENGLDEINDNLKWLCAVNNASSAVFKKSVVSTFLKEVAGFTYHGDWYFYLSLCFISDVYYSHHPLSFYRIHSTSLLNSTRFSIQKKSEHFKILRFLYYQPLVTEKKKLLRHFCIYFLGFGFMENGIVSAYKLIKTYYRIDRKLAAKTLQQIIKIKAGNKKYPIWND
jgi:glycosyltransferase involved in cell wall biosynthesis